MNTGIQRTVRGLCRNLRAHYAMTPLAWDPGRQSYALLSSREHGFLEKPFAGFLARRGRAVPGRLTNPVPLWSRFRRRLARRRTLFDLPAHLRSDDTLIVPEIFRDERAGWLKNLRRKTEARWIAFFHDAIAWRRPEITSAKRKEGVMDYMRALGCFDDVVAVSEEAANDLRDFWSESGEDINATIQINPWPVDDHFTAPSTETPVCSGRERPNILCVGTLEARKNHLTLLEAAKKIWREQGAIFDLTLIGRKTTGFGDRVIAKVNQLRREGWPVRWLRHVDDRRLVAAYDASSFTVFPSLVEGFGLPIIESLRRGRPCICGGSGSLGERARDGGCLIVDQTSADALADAMQRLLTDKDLYSRLVREARARRFETWENFIVKQRSLFAHGSSLVCAG